MLHFLNRDCQKTVLIVFSGGVYVGENTESDGKRIRAGFQPPAIFYSLLTGFISIIRAIAAPER